MTTARSPAHTDHISCISRDVHEAQGAVPQANGRPRLETLLETLRQKGALTSCIRRPKPLQPAAPAPDQSHL